MIMNLEVARLRARHKCLCAQPLLFLLFAKRAFLRTLRSSATSSSRLPLCQFLVPRTDIGNIFCIHRNNVLRCFSHPCEKGWERRPDQASVIYAITELQDDHFPDGSVVVFSEATKFWMGFFYHPNLSRQISAGQAR